MLTNAAYLSTMTAATVARAQAVRITERGSRRYLAEGGAEPHWVDLSDPEIPACDCGFTTWRDCVCKHVAAALFHERDPHARLAAWRAWEASPEHADEVCPVGLPIVAIVSATGRRGEGPPADASPAVRVAWIRVHLLVTETTGGRRLRQFFGPRRFDLTYETPDSAEHVAGVLQAERPLAVLSFGPVAAEALGARAALPGIRVISGPDPAARGPETLDGLARMARLLDAAVTEWWGGMPATQEVTHG